MYVVDLKTHKQLRAVGLMKFIYIIKYEMYKFYDN